MTSTLKFIETSKLPTDVGEFTVHAFTDEIKSKDHLAISMGDLLTKLRKMEEELFFIFNKKEEV